ncbi:MAG: hypothetical protein ACRD6B_07625 [Bryobacteraceae bacterium]
MPENSQDEIRTLTGVCLALISQVVATQAVLCQLDKEARGKLKAALIASNTEKLIKDKGKMLDETTVTELSQIVLRMPLQLDEMLSKRG